jgi:NAD-dependent DNA ligase
VSREIHKIAITGKHPVGRNEIVKSIEESGHVFSKSVTKDTNFLLVEDVESNTKKLNDARNKGVSLISFDELVEMLNK